MDPHFPFPGEYLVDDTGRRQISAITVTDAIVYDAVSDTNATVPLIALERTGTHEWTRQPESMFAEVAPVGSVWRSTDPRRTATRFTITALVEGPRPYAVVASVAPDGRERKRIVHLDRLDRYERIVE